MYRKGDALKNFHMDLYHDRTERGRKKFVEIPVKHHEFERAPTALPGEVQSLNKLGKESQVHTRETGASGLGLNTKSDGKLEEPISSTSIGVRKEAEGEADDSHDSQQNQRIAPLQDEDANRKVMSYQINQLEQSPRLPEELRSSLHMVQPIANTASHQVHNQYKSFEKQLKLNG